MTYYLEEFKKWLNADPSRKKGKTEGGWKNTFSIIEDTIGHVKW